MLKRRFNLFICAAMLMLSLCLTSCSLFVTNTGRFEFEDEDKNTKGIVISDISEYTVVRGDLCSDEEKAALVTFRETVMKNLGITLPALTDWIGEGQEEREKEILIGETNREESIEAREGLGYNDFVIKKVGTKLVIAGGSGVSTQAAVDYFVENYIDIYQSTLCYPESGYKYVQEYLISSISIDGTPISEYKLYANDPEIDLTEVQTALSDSVAGVYIEIAETPDEYSKYIVFDNTDLVASRYGTELEDNGNLYVYGSYDSFDTAVEYFCGAYFEELAAEKGTRDIDITWHDDKTKEVGKKEIYTKEALMELLGEVYADRDSIILGEMISGSQSMPSYTLENFYNATGKYPAMIGIDLAGYGLQLGEMSSADWSHAICELVDYAADGGIITATAHFENPTGNWTLGDKSRGILGGEDKWEELLTEGSELNLKFKYELSSYAAFLKALDDNEVPVLWRPLHESNSNSFWYGAIQDDTTVGAEYLKRLWIYIYEYYASLGIDNLIWVYSPVVTNGEAGTMPVMYAYPGDEYVDMVGCDWITADESELDGSGKSYETLINESGKIGALTEFGLRSGSELVGNTREDQLTRFNGTDLAEMLTELRSKGYSFAYILLKNGTNSITWLGDGEYLVGEEMILTLDDIAPRLGAG